MGQQRLSPHHLHNVVTHFQHVALTDLFSNLAVEVDEDFLDPNIVDFEKLRELGDYASEYFIEETHYDEMWEVVGQLVRCSVEHLACSLWHVREAAKAVAELYEAADAITRVDHAEGTEVVDHDVMEKLRAAIYDIGHHGANVEE